MATIDADRQRLLLETQIALYQRQARWEPWKALAALIAAAAVFAGGVLAVAAWWHPAPQVFTVHIDGKLPLDR
jgi:hypothetical protein